MEDYSPSLPADKYLSIGEKANSFTATTSPSDNDHWYIITQTRGGETPAYNAGLGTKIMRAPTSVTISTLDGASVEYNAAYLIRFISAGEGLYNIQFADGCFINSGLNTTLAQSDAASYAFYNTVTDGTTFGWNLNSNTGSIVDNNGAGSGLNLWGSGTVTATSGNNVWSIYPVTFTDAIYYPFSTTGGAFFQGLTTNKAAASNVYCNLWLSKNTAGKPQLKLITNDASSSGGNNMRSTGGLFTTANASGYTYNLSVSEGKITSYTIVGTAVGALSITPDGGSAEEFAASASVSKKVTLDTPAKQTSFKLTTLGSGAQWLDVTRFVIEYETDATTITSLSGISNDGIYTLEPHNAERGVLYAGTTYLDACGGHANTNYPANKSTAIDASDPNQQFVLYTYDGNTYLYNVGRAKFAGVADDLYYKLTGAPVNTWTVSTGAYDKYFRLTSVADSKILTINAWTNTGSSDSKEYGVTGMSANEEANNLLLRRVGTLTSEQQTAIETAITNYLMLQTSLATLGEYTIGTELCQYTNASIATEEAKETMIANIQDGLKDCEASDVPTANTQVQALISSMILNLPAVGNFYRIKGYATNKYAKAGTITASNVDTGNDPSSKIPNTVNTETNGSDLWFYDSESHLINYYNGLGTVATRAFASLGKTKETTTFAASTCSASGAKKTGVYEIKSNYSGSQVWYSNTDNVDRNSKNDHVNCEWIVESVASLPITMRNAEGAYFGTVNLPVAVVLPDGLMAYKASVEGEVMTLTKVVENGVLAANTPVVLYSESQVTEVAISGETGTGASINALQGTVAAEAVTAGDNYVLSGGSKGVGFYKFTGTTMPGFKAYLPASAGGGVKAFSFSFEDMETAIRAIENENSGLEIYDISGRRVPQAGKGLYIVNGKKVMFK